MIITNNCDFAYVREQGRIPIYIYEFYDAVKKLMEFGVIIE